MAWRVWCVVLGLVLTATTAWGGPRVRIVTPPESSKLVQWAAQDLALRLSRQFEAEVTVGSETLAGEGIILLGNPQTNPQVRAAVGDAWPRMGVEGHLVRSVAGSNPPTVVVGGNSDLATAWGATDLAHHFGFRTLLTGETTPLDQPSFSLTGLDRVCDPQIAIRAFHLLGTRPRSTTIWSLADLDSLLRRIVKNKFNQVVLDVGADQPFTSVTWRGTTSAELFLFGDVSEFPIAADMPGRRVFQGKTLFRHPDWPSSPDAGSVIATGESWLRQVIEQARGYGLSVALQLPEPLFPRALRARLKGADDATMVDARQAVIAAWSSRYPGVTLLGVDPAREGKAPSLELGISASSPAWIPQSVSPRDLRRIDQAVAAKAPRVDLRWSSFLSGADPLVYYLQRAVCGVPVTDEELYLRLYTPVGGRSDVAERVALAHGFLAVAHDHLADWQNATQLPTDPLSIYQGKLDRAGATALAGVASRYILSYNECLRAHGNCHPEARTLLFYYSKRGEFGLHFFNGLVALAEANLARSVGDGEKQLEQLEKGVEAFYMAGNALGEVARDATDRGILLELDRLVYRPLLAELDRVTAAQ